MAKDDYEGEGVAKGHWLYGDVPKCIEIVAFDCDYFYERLPMQDSRAVWKPYPLNEEGCLLYVKVEGEILPTKPFATVEEAKRWAEAQPWGVHWE